MFKRFMSEEEGATMVEYGLMIALIAVVLIVIVSTLGQNLKNAFIRTNTEDEESFGGDGIANFTIEKKLSDNRRDVESRSQAFDGCPMVRQQMPNFGGGSHEDPS